MTELELYRDLCSHFLSGLEGTDYEDIKIEWPNVRLPAPPAAVSPDGHAEPWIRYNFEPVTGGQTTLAGDDGQAKFATRGVIIHQIFVPPYQGLGVALAIAESVKAVYDGVSSVGGVWFRNTRSNNVGLSGSWYQYNISVNFDYDTKR